MNINVNTAAIKLAYAPGMTIGTLTTMLAAERQHQFKDELTDFYIKAIEAAIKLLEEPMFN